MRSLMPARVLQQAQNPCSAGRHRAPTPGGAAASYKIEVKSCGEPYSPWSRPEASGTEVAASIG